jgi:hypothetical protein
MAFFFLLTAIAILVDEKLYSVMCRRSCQTVFSLAQLFGEQTARILLSFGWLIASAVTAYIARKMPRE